MDLTWQDVAVAGAIGVALLGVAVYAIRAWRALQRGECGHCAGCGGERKDSLAKASEGEQRERTVFLPADDLRRAARRK